MSAEDWLILLLIVFNVSAGGGLALPLAGRLRQIRGKGDGFIRYSMIFAGIYFAECVAFPFGMCTQVFTVSLSFVWGLVFGLWLRKYSQAGSIKRLAIFIAVYGSLPTASLCILLPLVRAIAGGDILSASEGFSFGIPDFLPWPFNTILGFFAALLAGTLVLKIFAAYATVSYVISKSKG